MAIHGSFHKIQSVQGCSSGARDCYSGIRSLLHLRILFHERRASWTREGAWKWRASLSAMDISGSWTSAATLHDTGKEGFEESKATERVVDAPQAVDGLLRWVEKVVIGCSSFAPFLCISQAQRCEGRLFMLLTFQRSEQPISHVKKSRRNAVSHSCQRLVVTRSPNAL